MQHFLLNVLPMLAGIVLAVSYLPQLKQTYKTKNVEGISLTFWLILSVALFMLTVSTGSVFYYYGSYGNFIVEGFNFLLATTMLAMVLQYRKRKE